MQPQIKAGDRGQTNELLEAAPCMLKTACEAVVMGCVDKPCRLKYFVQ